MGGPPVRVLAVALACMFTAACSRGGGPVSQGGPFGAHDAAYARFQGSDRVMVGGVLADSAGSITILVSTVPEFSAVILQGLGDPDDESLDAALDDLVARGVDASSVLTCVVHMKGDRSTSMKVFEGSALCLPDRRQYLAIMFQFGGGAGRILASPTDGGPKLSLMLDGSETSFARWAADTLDDGIEAPGLVWPVDAGGI